MRIKFGAHNALSVARAGRISIVAAAAIASIVLISACGSSSSSSGTSASQPVPTSLLDTHRVALSIEQTVFAQRHVHVKVTCPPVMPQQKGRNFSCIARPRRTTESIPVAVTQQNNSGYVTFKVE